MAVCDFSENVNCPKNIISVGKINFSENVFSDRINGSYIKVIKWNTSEQKKETLQPSHNWLSDSKLFRIGQQDLLRGILISLMSEVSRGVEYFCTTFKTYIMLHVTILFVVMFIFALSNQKFVKMLLSTWELKFLMHYLMI